MPNISFDIFFNDDTVNITASRGTNAPKIKPEWKVRTAPKLPPKEPPQKPTAVFGKPKALTEKPAAPEKPAPKKLAPKAPAATNGEKSAPKKLAPKAKPAPIST
ncbi:hypothetical protein MMC25_001720 [Agyrium rufum]|nr:hypothetical protein [Agyrium rufum]